MTSIETRRTLALQSSVQYLKGVGPARAGLLASAGVETVLDLLRLAPLRYEDRRVQTRIAEVRPGEGGPVTLRGHIVSCASKISPVKRLKIVEAILDDGSGTIMLVWFNQPYVADQLGSGARVAVYGQPRLNSHGRLQLESPDFERLGADGEDEEEGTIVPVYSRVAAIPPKVVRGLIQNALESIATIEDPLPVELRVRLGVMDLQRAIIRLHRPEELDESFLSGRSPVHARFILEEFLAFQLGLRARRAEEERPAKPRRIAIDEELRREAADILPYRLTSAQKRVLREIVDDMTRSRPMYRLLQGDVGSGKTIVAVMAGLVAIRNGHQVALMAPTEILAEQHLERIQQLVESSDVRIEKLTAATPGRERARILEDLRRGTIQFLIGTHAMLEEPVVFRSLGLAIVDEQHRFGVVQRRKLFDKGDLPDVLVMTATPIPRSLAIALYGDLDLSVIDELPPGRKSIRTVVRGTARLGRVLEFVGREIAAGARAYVVCPIIEESDAIDVKALKTRYDEIRRALPGRRIGMLHGRMPADEKRRTMREFESGGIDVLVSTTVIEVGIDVPEASVMVVFDADRFGLAQLHQLRGRVGRGRRKSWCVLLRDETSSEDAKARLRTFESTADGFDVADRDLEMRGAGDFLGTRQSGIPRFRFGDIHRDHGLMELARDAAKEFVEARGAAEALAVAARLQPRLPDAPAGRD